MWFMHPRQKTQGSRAKPNHLRSRRSRAENYPRTSQRHCRPEWREASGAVDPGFRFSGYLLRLRSLLAGPPCFDLHTSVKRRRACTDQCCKPEESPCQRGAVHTWHKAKSVEVCSFLLARTSTKRPSHACRTCKTERGPTTGELRR